VGFWGYIYSPDSYARDGPIDKDENCNDGVDMLLVLSRNTLHLKRILLETASVEDVNLGKRPCALVSDYVHKRTNASTYHYAVLARYSSCSVLILEFARPTCSVSVLPCPNGGGTKRLKLGRGNLADLVCGILG